MSILVNKRTGAQAKSPQVIRWSVFTSRSWIFMAQLFSLSISLSHPSLTFTLTSPFSLLFQFLSLFIFLSLAPLSLFIYISLFLSSLFFVLYQSTFLFFPFLSLASCLSCSLFLSSLSLYLSFSLPLSPLNPYTRTIRWVVTILKLRVVKIPTGHFFKKEFLGNVIVIEHQMYFT